MLWYKPEELLFPLLIINLFLIESQYNKLYCIEVENSFYSLDVAPHRNGKGHRQGSFNGNRSLEICQSPRPTSKPKSNKSYSVKRPRQRGSYEDRQREEVGSIVLYFILLQLFLSVKFLFNTGFTII